MSTPLIDLQVEAGIATLTLNRPEKRNAMSDAMRTAFIHALEQVAADKAIRALVLTGAGKGFCAGGDISGMEKRMNAPTGEIAFNGWHRQQGVHHTQMLLHTMPKPVIAAVNGAASGLGADTALACDFVIASEWGSFSWSYIHRGIIPDGGGLYFLPRRVGLSKAKELVFTGRKVEVDEALALGIVDRKTSADTLVADAQAWARELSQGSATALALGKTILNQTFELPAQQVFAQGSQAQGICYTSTEHRDAVMAFLNKTAPQA
ncbi:enoyl-CoA hydratase/isomerase family protein [Hydrogenophaga sp. PBL-H3]|uniref:enoyl-CoA hydratase/isomerase family protein n=1 Tax=Hydrogenophaga sp. PBL-H3 TaxID=434010 RepID=UPI00131F9D63|nr:enoyl-CoA hydratase-related protein [Hydrogenophaga sp. PBL-H3]QHE74915.1 enoyl-CoA hydratase/isomerase family protein [Hydrogenophaga sp. PBL-H3]QHE79342.1 enoyl-CoA hydratase/isomerase family protein [Hydrogenophaga sp. PBL-H3]